MSNIRLEMPVLARHEGEWIGTYTLVAEVLNVKKILIKIAQNMLNFGRRIIIF